MLKPEPNQPGQVIFSTEGMSSQESFERWRDLYKGSTMTTRIEAGGTGNFTAQTRVQAIGELGLLSNNCHQDFAVQFNRGKSEIARSQDQPALLLLSTCRESSFKYGRDDVTTMRPGDWILLDPSDILWAHSENNLGEFHVLSLPPQFGEAMRLIKGDNGFGCHRSSEHLLNRLVTNYIQTLAAGGAIADAATGDAVSRNLMELITLAVQTSQKTRETCDNGLVSGLFLAITQYLNVHYMHPQLSPAQIAAQFGITPRYVHRMFERTGTTFTEQLYLLRLRHAHYLLTNTLHRKRSITDIAYDCGFQNLSHFGRRYREMYAQTPSEARSSSAN